MRLPTFAAFILGLMLAVPMYAAAVPSSVDRITNRIEPLIKTDSIRGLFFTASSTSQASTLPLLSSSAATATALAATQICLTGDTCRTTWPTGGSGGGLSTTTSWLLGELAYVTSSSSVGSTATGTLTEGVTGLELTATRYLVGGSAVLNLTSGYQLLTTASGTAYDTFYNAPSSRITAGTGIDWSGNTLNGVYTAGDGLTLNTEDFDCDTASGTVFGCLSAANWTTFNDKADLSSAMTGTFDGNNFAGGAVATGDLLYGASAGSISELSIGTAGQILTIAGGLPAWVSTSTMPLGGDVTGTLGTTVVGNDSHDHTSATLSGIDISADTNLTAGDALTLTDDDIDFDGGASPAGALGGTWASPTVDNDGHSHTGATLSGIDLSDDVNLTAGDALTLTGDDIDFDGGTAPSGELGGTWGAITIDDSIAVTSWNLTTPTLTSFFGTPCTGNEFLQDIGDTGTFTCAAASGGGGALSTTTDNNPEVGEVISYITDDFYIGGSASNTAEFNFDVESATFTISSTSAAAAFLGLGTTSSPTSATLSIHAGAQPTPFFAIGSSTASLFTINAFGGITLSASQPATTTALTLDWNASPQLVEYRIGTAATTITVINATTTANWGSRKVVTVCNPGTTAGALTWAGPRWIGTAPTQTTTAHKCDVYSFIVTRATSSSAYTLAGTAGTGL